MTRFSPNPFAPDHVVTTTADDGPGSLRAAVAAADSGDVIGFAGSLSGATIALNSAIALGQSVVIDGSAAPGVTLDGRMTNGIFTVSRDGVLAYTFQSLRLVRGRRNTSGGAISLNGNRLTVEIAGCVFENNSSEEGGAVRVGYGTNTTVWIRDSVFLNNEARPATGGRMSSGAVATIGTRARVSRVRFEGNRGSLCGALYGLGSNPLVEDCLFLNNEASNGSGGFFVDGGNGQTYNAGRPAAVIGRIAIQRCRFHTNRGQNADGGAAQLYAYPIDRITVEDSVFFGNEANPGRGGALFLHADNGVRLARTAFVNNYATRQGGCIWADGGDANFLRDPEGYDLENLTFVGNRSDEDQGGAMTMNFSPSLSLRIASCTFFSNRADIGHGVMWIAGANRPVTLSNTVLQDNPSAPGRKPINFPVIDAGGNFVWPPAQAGFSVTNVQDSQLTPAAEIDGTWIAAPNAGSPLVGAAAPGGPTVDQRGANRDADPDSGAFEVGALCQGTVTSGSSSGGSGTGATSGSATGGSSSGATGSGSQTSGAGATTGGGSTGGSGTGSGSGGSSSGADAGGTSAGGTPCSQPTNSWRIVLKRPRDPLDRGVRFKPGKTGVGLMRGAVIQTGLPRKFSGMAVEAAWMGSTQLLAYSNDPCGAIPWRAADKMGKATREGAVGFRFKRFGANQSVATGEIFEIWIRASTNWTSAVTQTNRFRFRPRE